MTTRHIKKITVVLSALILLTTSCKKFKDINPTDTVDPSKAFRNLNDINMGLLGAYAYLDYTLMGTTSIVTDEAMVPLENTVSNLDAYRWQYTAANGSVTSAYNDYYVSIDRANRALAAIDQITLLASDVPTRERYRGELLAMRAYCHFELLRAYASSYDANALGVAYMKKSEISYPSRESFAAVVADIKADLIAAKALIPSTFTDKTRITKIAVSAMQARLALYEKNWADAITYSTEVIQALPLATKAQFPGLWTDANDSEVAWKLKRTGTTDSRIGSFYYRESGGIVLYAPSNKLINTYNKTTDLRYAAYIKFDATRGTGKSQYLVNKYIGGTPSTAPGLTDIKLFRTGEMYLIRAEAEAESTTLTDAANDLNALRAARINAYVNETFGGDKGVVISAIYTERFKELAFEGHRFFDLKRRNYPIDRLPEDAVSAAGAVHLDNTQAQYSFPIPAVELTVNPNIVQNPKY